MAQTAGYSGTPLHKKLGFKPGMSVLVVNGPSHYDALLDGADDVTFHHDPARGPFDAVHLFFETPEVISEQATAALPMLREGGMLWVSWAKKSSALHSGVTEDHMRMFILPSGWVDVKVCAVDVDWSGLKFLKRKAK